jgi:hypothetical protein
MDVFIAIIEQVILGNERIAEKNFEYSIVLFMIRFSDSSFWGHKACSF